MKTVLPDGTVEYSYPGKGVVMRYKPGQGRKWEPKERSEHAVRFHTRWFEPLQLIDDDRRTMPRTRPDEDGAKHKILCRCDICRDNPRIVELKQYELGLRRQPPGPRP